MEFVYRATFAPEEDGGFLVTFADVPEAITQGDDIDDAMSSASEALGLALRGLAKLGREIPEPRTVEGVPVAVDPEIALKLAVISAFRASKISKSELGRRLGKDEAEARRILDPDHPTKLRQLRDTLLVLGKEIVVTVRDAA